MYPAIESNRSALRALCQKHHVKSLFVFGSAIGNQFNEQSSDLDFLVEFLPIPTAKYADAYFGLQEDLEALFHKKIDLVETKPIRNPYFRQAVEQTKVPLYEAA